MASEAELAEKLDRFTSAVLRESLSLDEFAEWMKVTQPESPVDEFVEHWQNRRVLLAGMARMGWLALFFDWLMTQESQAMAGPGSKL